MKVNIRLRYEHSKTEIAGRDHIHVSPRMMASRRNGTLYVGVTSDRGGRGLSRLTASRPTAWVADSHPFRLSLGEAANPRNTSIT